MINKPYEPEYQFEVRITEPPDKEGRMSGIYTAFDWLEANGYDHSDFIVDMYGGVRNYCSLWFRDRDKAMVVKLSIGGA